MNYPSRKTFFLPEYPIIHLSLSLSCQHHSYVLFASAFPALTFSLRSQAFPVTRRQLPPPPAPPRPCLQHGSSRLFGNDSTPPLFWLGRQSTRAKSTHSRLLESREYKPCNSRHDNVRHYSHYNFFTVTLCYITAYFTATRR